MTYSAKEVFLTVQGEGGQAGRPAVVLRFAGCN
nr:7-carboxy-7-deazaguanine synthase [Brevundimonas sp.]